MAKEQRTQKDTKKKRVFSLFRGSGSQPRSDEAAVGDGACIPAPHRFAHQLDDRPTVTRRHASDGPARELIFTGRDIDARKALEIGLVNELLHSKLHVRCALPCGCANYCDAKNRANSSDHSGCQS